MTSTAHDPTTAPLIDDPPRRLLSVTAKPGGRSGRVVVEAVGDVDSATAPLLELCVRSQASQPHVRELVVDLRRVPVLAAAGGQVLEGARQLCTERGVRFVVRGAGGRERPCGSAHPGRPRRHHRPRTAA
jgi:anti-anti-sigma factor